MGRLIASAVALAAGTVVLLAAPAGAATSGGLQVNATIDGQDVAGRTVTVDPAPPAQLVITVTARNNGDATQKIRSVRLSGKALALTFFAYDTVVPFDVPAHDVVNRTFTIDVADLQGQAIGLLPASVELLDNDRNVVASVDTIADVRGSMLSVYGVFGIAMLVLTVLAWLGALLALARHRLPANRWRRALRFLPAGIGTGLVAVVSLSVFRLVAPEIAIEVPIVLGAAVIALLLGYLTPTPNPVAAQPQGTQYLPQVNPWEEDATVNVTTQFHGQLPVPAPGPWQQEPYAGPTAPQQADPTRPM
jgi:hypothetical protein